MAEPDEVRRWVREIFYATHDPQCSLRDVDEMPSARRCTCADAARNDFGSEVAE